MAVKRFNAEGGTDGSTPTTSDAFPDAPSSVGTVAGGVNEFDNAHPAHGGTGVAFATRGTAGRSYLAWDEGTGVGTGWQSFYFYFDEAPSATGVIFECRDTASGNVVGRIYMGADRKISARGSDGVAAWTSAALSTGTLYRISAYVDPTAAGNSNMRVKYYLGDDESFVEDSGDVVVTQGGVSATYREVRVGANPHANIANWPTATGKIWVDDVVMYDTVEPGPTQHQRTVTPATETDTAQALSVTQASALSQYSGALDVLRTDHVNDTDEPVDADDINLMADAVMHTQATLGVDAEGGFADVAARITDAESRLTSTEGRLDAIEETPFNLQTGASYTAVAADVGKVVSMNNAAANTLLLPPGLPVGSSITIRQAGAGQTTVDADTGATVDSRDSAFKLAGQRAYATALVVGTDAWELFGDITT